MAIEDLQPLTYAIITLAFFFGTASVFLRMYCRALVVEGYSWDDIVPLSLLLVNTVQQTVLYMFMHYGCGKHIGTLTDYQVEKITTWLFVEEIFYMFTHWTIKQCFLLFYLRLSPSVTFRRCVIVAMVLNAAFTITNWLLAFLQCIPFDAIFHSELYPNAKCINTYVLLMGPSALNLVTDFIILGLPVPIVWNLQMPRRRKVAVLLVMSFGVSSVIIAICRFAILYELGTMVDISYTLGKMVIVAALEIESAIIAVNLPSMKVLYTKITGGSSTGQSEPLSDSRGYKLSSVEGRREGFHFGRRNKPKPMPDSITHHIGGITTTESEEELCRAEQQGEHANVIKVTNDIKITTGDEDTDGSKADVTIIP